MKKLVLISAVFFLASCGGGSGGSSNSDDGPVVVTSNQSVEIYQDSFVRLTYPSDWTLDTSDPNVSALFRAPEMTAAGGNPSCNINSIFAPGVTLLDAVDIGLEGFLEDPEPEVSFLTINGTAMARVSGLIDLPQSAITVEATIQYAQQDDTVHQLTCGAGVSQEETNLILDSLEIL